MAHPNREGSLLEVPIWIKREWTSHTGILCKFLTEGLWHGAKASLETEISGFHIPP
ncbi:hypothetical protein LEMLEM_LOCUS17269, partial [Lemmus lemmus]